MRSDTRVRSSTVVIYIASNVILQRSGNIHETFCSNDLLRRISSEAEILEYSVTRHDTRVGSSYSYNAILRRM